MIIQIRNRISQSFVDSFEVHVGVTLLVPLATSLTATRSSLRYVTFDLEKKKINKFSTPSSYQMHHGWTTKPLLVCSSYKPDDVFVCISHLTPAGESMAGRSPESLLYLAKYRSIWVCPCQRRQLAAHESYEIQVRRK